MSYFPDLSTRCDAGYGTDVRAIGWLDPDHPYPRGDTPAGFIDHLRKHVADACQLVEFRGLHECEFCVRSPPNPPNPNGRLLTEIAIGRRNLWVPTVDCVYIAPEMIVHYVVDHNYCPPDEFVRAVIACPPQESSEFMRLIDTFKPTQFPLEFDRRAKQQAEADRLAARERLNRAAEQLKTSAVWLFKGMCPKCGQWLYLYFEDDRPEHSGQPLTDVETRPSRVGHQQPG